MSGKFLHAVTGLGSGAAIAYFTKAPPNVTALLLLGSYFGASAPDWMEIARHKTRFRWFSANEHVRESLIPHRTITHVLLLWVLLLAYSGSVLLQSPSSGPRIVVFGFVFSALTHLLMDIRTPMGIPLLPFGKRYRLVGFRLRPSRVTQQRSGW